VSQETDRAASCSSQESRSRLQPARCRGLTRPSYGRLRGGHHQDRERHRRATAAATSATPSIGGESTTSSSTWKGPGTTPRQALHSLRPSPVLPPRTCRQPRTTQTHTRGPGGQERGRVSNRCQRPHPMLLTKPSRHLCLIDQGRRGPNGHTRAGRYADKIGIGVRCPSRAQSTTCHLLLA